MFFREVKHFKVSFIVHIVTGCLLNILTSGLIQAVRKKTAKSHVALYGNFSALVRVTDLVEVSKGAASLVVCTRKK